MKKSFNNVQIFNSSEDCKKFSKSVSYETLVGGTTTIGREIKQTRQLIKGNAVKPLTAVGTLTSLLCNSAKVVEKWLQISPVLRLVKIFSLLMVLSISAMNESLAENETPVCIGGHNKNVTCIDKLSDTNGNNSCGDNCTFKVIEENGKQVLHVYKTDVSKPATIRDGAFSPRYYADNTVLDANGNALPLENIVLDNDFEYAPFDAFYGSHAQISSASGKFVLNTGQVYFGTVNTLNGDVIFNNSVNQAVQNTIINGDVIISDNVTDITKFSFADSQINGNLVIPDTIKSVGGNAFINLSITGQIYCASGIENCYNMIKTGCAKNNSCLTSLDSLLESKKFSAYPDGCEKLEANLKCTKCKNSNFKLNDGECDRLRYTPAEAAKVLKDDNTNEITITFKK